VQNPCWHRLIHRTPSCPSTVAAMGTGAADITGRRRVALAAAVGLVAGFLSGMFGVGGGILIVPALVLALGFEQRLAHGTSLAAVLPIATSGLVAFAVEDKVDWRVGAVLALGAIVGAVVGTYALHLLPHRTLTIAFAVLLIATAVRLLIDHSEAAGREPLSVAGVIALVGVGVIAGALAGLLGVGGGIVLVPAMVVLFGIPGAVAKGTSLLVIIPTSVMGTLRNRKRDNADLRAAAAVGLAGVASGFPAGLIAAHLDETVSNVLFAILLLIVTARLLYGLERDRRLEPVAAE
jgi:uncharacterized membrane protein YfcA